MSSSYEERLDEVMSRLDRLTDFEVSEEEPFPDISQEKSHRINIYISVDDYRDGVNGDIEFLKMFLKDVLKIKDPERQKEFLCLVVEKVESLSFIDEKELRSRYAKENQMRIEWLKKYGGTIKAEKTYHEMRWGYEVHHAIGVYLDIKKRLNIVVGDVLDHGGYRKSSNGQLEGPYGTDELKKRFFSTRFDKKQLGLFIFLCEKAGVFKTQKGKKKKTRADLAEMFAENIVNKKGEHFSKKSISNHMTDKHVTTTKNAVKEVLKTMLKKIQKL